MENNKLELNKNLSILAKSSAFVFIGILLSKIFMYLYRIIIARHYGPEVYGLFSLAIMVFGFFVAFSSLGFSDGILRFIPIYRGSNKKDNIKYLRTYSYKILLFTSILSGFLLYLSSRIISINFFHDENLIIYLKIFAFLIPIQIFTNIYFSIIRSHEKIKINAFGVNILQNIIKFLLIILFIYFGLQSSKSVPLSYLFAIFSGFIFAYIYCRVKLPYIFLRPNLSQKNKRELRISLFLYSWPLILYSLIITLMSYLDTFLIGYFKDTYLVGIYNAAIPIAMLLTVTYEIFMQMFFPLITREISSKRTRLVKELSKQVTKWIFIINLPLTIMMLIFSGLFINLLFGQEYLQAINVLRLLAMGQFIYSMGVVSNNLLLSNGKSKIILYNLIFAGTINFILNCFLIPKYGIEGAAFATLISFTILVILLITENYYFNKIFPFRKKIITIFIISIIPTSILYKLSNYINVNIYSLIILGIFFILIYLFLILITKSFDENDWEIIKKVFKKTNKINLNLRL